MSVCLYVSLCVCRSVVSVRWLCKLDPAQQGLGQSNHKELTQKGTNMKKKSSHQERSSRRSTAIRAECFIVGVNDLADRELTRRLLQRLMGVSTDRLCGDPVVLNCHVVANQLVTLNRHVVLNRPLRRPHPSASFWGLTSSLKARTVVVGVRSVTWPLTGDNVQFELIAVSFVDLDVVYQ